MKDKTLFQRCEALGECIDGSFEVRKHMYEKGVFLVTKKVTGFVWRVTPETTHSVAIASIIEYFEKIKEGQKPRKMKKKKHRSYTESLAMVNHNKVKKLKKRVRANDIAIESLKTKIAHLENIVEHSGIQKIAFDNLTNGKGDEMTKGMLEKFGFEPKPEPFTLYAYGDGESVYITYERKAVIGPRKFLYDVQCIHADGKEVSCTEFWKVIVGDVCGAQTREGLKLVEIVGVGQAQPDQEQDAITREGLEALGFGKHSEKHGFGWVLRMKVSETLYYVYVDCGEMFSSHEENEDGEPMHEHLVGTFTTLSQIERLVALLKEVNCG